MVQSYEMDCGKGVRIHATSQILCIYFGGEMTVSTQNIMCLYYYNIITVYWIAIILVSLPMLCKLFPNCNPLRITCYCYLKILLSQNCNALHNSFVTFELYIDSGHKLHMCNTILTSILAINVSSHHHCWSQGSCYKLTSILKQG